MLQKDVDLNHEPNKEQYILQINVYNKHTGFIAASALIENAEVISTTINVNANGLATSEIIRLTFYIQSKINSLLI